MVRAECQRFTFASAIQVVSLMSLRRELYVSTPAALLLLCPLSSHVQPIRLDVKVRVHNGTPFHLTAARIRRSGFRPPRANRGGSVG